MHMSELNGYYYFHSLVSLLLSLDQSGLLISVYSWAFLNINLTWTKDYRR